jgi:GDP-D-mannose dehydratase
MCVTLFGLWLTCVDHTFPDVLYYSHLAYNLSWHWQQNNILSILQCQNGHTLCSTCKARVHNRCPTCRQELGDIRCLALEKVAESLELPCRYYSLGCPEIFPYYSKLKHESQCNFRPYSCPYAGSECSSVGDIPFLVSHLRDDHKVDMHSGSTFNHRYVKSNPREVENATWMLTVSILNFFVSRRLHLPVIFNWYLMYTNSWVKRYLVPPHYCFA